jgi:2-polyprenyl-3-methyl-5-hydroxy-6-metoxy-1,4-benzoquinol methylase
MEDPYLHYLNDKYRFPRLLVHRPIQRFFAAHLRELPAGSRLLDAGCGNGIESGPYAARLEVQGVDYQPSYVDYCNTSYPAARFKVANLEQLDYPDDYFDLVIMNQVIEHLERPRVVVEELARVLRPKGRLLVATPNYATLGWRLVEGTYHRWFVQEFDAESNHVTRYDPPMLRDHLSGSLSVERVRTVCLRMILVASGRKAR